jgi:hypothetical protein
MKPLLQFCCLALLAGLLGCGDSIIKHSEPDASSTAQAANTSVKIPVPVATKNKIIKDDKDLTGYWVGAFSADSVPDTNRFDGDSKWEDANKINISIDTLSGNKVSGHSIVAGNFRPFTGTVEHTGNTYRFLAKEPGDDKYDGVFTFSINTGDSVLAGTWKASQQIKTPVRYYNLTKRYFSYDPSINIGRYRFADTNKQKKISYKDEDGAKYTDIAYAMSTVDFSEYNASAKLLTANQLANLKAADLLIIRNSIFARHGYSFKKPAIRSFFDQQAWYVPVSTDVTSMLTRLEKQNITLLLRYEKNAKQYYDTFGR